MRFISSVCALASANRRTTWLFLLCGFLALGQGCNPPHENQMDDGSGDTSSPDDTPPPDQNNGGMPEALDSAFIENGTLHIKGTEQNTRLALRLSAGVPTILVVDFGYDGTAEFSFDRTQFDHILVETDKGDDFIRTHHGSGGPLT